MSDPEHPDETRDFVVFDDQSESRIVKVEKSGRGWWRVVTTSYEGMNVVRLPVFDRDHQRAYTPNLDLVHAVMAREETHYND